MVSVQGVTCKASIMLERIMKSKVFLLKSAIFAILIIGILYYLNETLATSRQFVLLESYTFEFPEAVRAANKIKRTSDVLLASVVNGAYLPFAYSWLCNTKDMDIHKSVLIITTDEVSRDNLTRDWPEIGVVYIGNIVPKGDQNYSQAGYVKVISRRTEILFSILLSNIDILVFEVDCLWFRNPLPELKRRKGVDMLVNPVARRKAEFASGFLYLFPTERTKMLWSRLVDQLHSLGRRIAYLPDKVRISEEDNDQKYMSILIAKRYSGITYQILPMNKYEDGLWYDKPEAERQKSHPVIVNNNWVIGNKAKIARAKKWKHWFVRDDNTCDMDLVRNTVYTSS